MLKETQVLMESCFCCLLFRNVTHRFYSARQIAFNIIDGRGLTSEIDSARLEGGYVNLSDNGLTVSLKCVVRLHVLVGRLHDQIDQQRSSDSIKR